MAITLNLNAEEIKNAQGGNFEPLPAGTYGAVIFDSKLGMSKAGNQMYIIDYKITEGPAGVGRKQRAWYVLQPNALFSLNGLLKAVDMPYPTKDTPAGEFEFPDPEDFLGLEVNIKLDLETYKTIVDDKPATGYRNNVKRVFAYDPDKITGDDEDSAAPAAGKFL